MHSKKIAEEPRTLIPKKGIPLGPQVRPLVHEDSAYLEQQGAADIGSDQMGDDEVEPESKRTRLSILAEPNGASNFRLTSAQTD